MAQVNKGGAHLNSWWDGADQGKKEVEVDRDASVSQEGILYVMEVSLEAVFAHTRGLVC
jgi:hypothetical protein